MKSQLSSFELRHLLSEFQFLVGAKIEKVFQQPKPRDEFLFVLHVPGKGKQYLYLSLPDIICLSSFKPVFPEVPPHFAAGLRRKVSNARIQSITQKDFERVIIIELSTKLGASFLIIEFFTPGNIILVDENYKILSVLHPKKWQDRSVLPAKEFLFAPAQRNPLDLTLDSFVELLKNSDKDSLVKSIAVDCSLGGEYAEEVVFRSGLDKNVSPGTLVVDDIAKLFAALTSLLHEKTNAHASQKAMYPIKFQSKQDLLPVPSFNEAIEKYILSAIEHEEKKTFTVHATKTQSKFEKIISAQQKQLASLEKSEVENQEKGELIYAQYTALKTLLDKIDELRSEGKSWADIKEVLKAVPQVKKLDESTGTLELDLEVVS